MRRLLTFLRSASHTPLDQLIHRVRLLVKRKTLSRTSRLFPALALPREIEVPALSSDLPHPILRHLDVARRENGDTYLFDLLNAPRSFRIPIPWHLPELDHGTRLWKLHLHYLDYLQELEDDELVALIEDWITQNRPYCADYWKDCWNSYALSIRVVAWMGEYARRHRRLDASFATKIVRSIHEQIVFLQSNLERDIRGNHIVRNIKALYWASRFFQGSFATGCQILADELLLRELPVQVLEDGFHFELSPAYHCQVFGDLLDCWRLQVPGPAREKLTAALAMMAPVVANFTHGDGCISLFNDGGLTMTWSPGELLEAFESFAGRAPEKPTSRWYPAAGYAVWRHGPALLIFDAGRVGPDGLPAHAHGDILAFELSIGDQRVFVDAGVFEYSSGSRRNASRSTLSHNTLSLDGLDQCEFWGSFRLGRRATVTVEQALVNSEAMQVCASHTGYAHLPGQPIHQREMKAVPGRIEIVDRIVGGHGQKAQMRFLLHPDVRILDSTSRSIAIETKYGCIQLEADGVIQIIDSYWWPDFGEEVATRQIVVNADQASGEWHTVIHYHMDMK